MEKCINFVTLKKRTMNEQYREEIKRACDVLYKGGVILYLLFIAICCQV